MRAAPYPRLHDACRRSTAPTTVILTLPLSLPGATGHWRSVRGCTCSVWRPNCKGELSRRLRDATRNAKCFQTEPQNFLTFVTVDYALDFQIRRCQGMFTNRAPFDNPSSIWLESCHKK